MIIEDFSVTGLDRIGPIDLCIVGTGPAGLTIARELSGTPLRVLLIESGGLQESADSEALNEVENVGPAFMEVNRNRVLGGSSHTWSGRCAPLDAIDYEARPWVKYSGWPLTAADMAPYFRRAAAYLGISTSEYGLRFWKRPNEPDINPALLDVFCWQYSRDPFDRFDYTRFSRMARQVTASKVKILLHATVTQILPDSSNSGCHTLELAYRGGRSAMLRTPRLVLAAGGIENARLLLASTKSAPGGIGNENGLVGRFLTEHPRCAVGTFDLADTRRVFDRLGRYLLSPSQGGYILIHGFRLSPDLQRSQHLLNAAAWLGGEVADDDPITAARRLIAGPRRPRDLWSVLSQPGQAMRSLSDAVKRQREVSRKYSRLTLECTVEQPPNPESRVTLSDKRDALGNPIPQINWQVGAAERESIATLAKLVAAELARVGLPRLRLADWITQDQHDRAEFVEFAHPMGATRMSSNRRDGVVDENCQIHGLNGIYVAGSSVFPTGGHVNPTYTIVALAIRLAEHLKEAAVIAKAG